MKQTYIYPVIRHISLYILQNATVLVKNRLQKYCNVLTSTTFVNEMQS